MKRVFSLIAWCGMLLLMLSIPFEKTTAQSQNNEWAREVRRQLRANASALSDYDIVPSHEVFVGTLNHNYYKDIDYQLDAGVRYVFTGACDRDCTDLDLKIFDDQWNLIASDTRPDDTPYLFIVVRRTGTFHLRVIMSHCNHNPCWWGTGAYKPAND